MKRKINFRKFEDFGSPLCGRVLRVALPGKDQWLVEVGDAHSWKVEKVEKAGHLIDDLYP